MATNKEFYEINTESYDYGQQYIDINAYKRNPAVVEKIRGHKLYKLRKYKAERLYKLSETYGEKRLNLPYDFKETLLSKMLSPYIYRKRDVGTYLSFINDWVVALLKGVGKLKVLKNFTVDKDYKYIK